MAEQKSPMAEVKLFKTWSSPFGLRIVWALKHKGIQYESIDEDLSSKSSLLLQYNPVHKKVPVLIHNGKAIAESLVILEYIDETWKQYPLIPQDPYDRSMARFWAKFGDDKVVPSILGVLKKEGKEQDEAIAQSMENLNLLEEQLKGKKFFGGENLGLTDIALGWLANLVSVFEEVTDTIIIDKEKFPLLSAWIKEFAEVPIIRESWPVREKLVFKFRAIREDHLEAARPK